MYKIVIPIINLIIAIGTVIIAPFLLLGIFIWTFKFDHFLWDNYKDLFHKDIFKEIFNSKFILK